MKQVVAGMVVVGMLASPGFLYAQDRQEASGQAQVQEGHEEQAQPAQEASVAERLQHMRKLRQDDPQRYERERTALVARLRERVGVLRQRNPEAYERIVRRELPRRDWLEQDVKAHDRALYERLNDQRRQALRRRLEAMQREHPEAYHRLMDRRAQALERHFTRKFPNERLKEFVANHPELAQRLPDLQARLQQTVSPDVRQPRPDVRRPEAQPGRSEETPRGPHDSWMDLSQDRLNQLNLSDRELQRLQQYRSDAAEAYQRARPEHRRELPPDLQGRRERARERGWLPPDLQRDDGARDHRGQVSPDSRRERGGSNGGWRGRQEGDFGGGGFRRAGPRGGRRD